jgi:DNA-binding HxlR family transcriptional regulator
MGGGASPPPVLIGAPPFRARIYLVGMTSEPTRDVFHDDGTRVCSIADALAVVGDRWSLLVIREIDLGVRRFNDIQQRTGAPRQILTARLRKLETSGVVERRQYTATPPRYEYELTAAGEALRSVLADLRGWGERYASVGAMSSQGSGSQ